MTDYLSNNNKKVRFGWVLFTSNSLVYRISAVNYWVETMAARRASEGGHVSPELLLLFQWPPSLARRAAIVWFNFNYCVLIAD